MAETKRRKSGQFAKGYKGGPGRPAKKTLVLDKISSDSVRERLFRVFMQVCTEKEIKELISTKKNRMLFMQEIRRMLPVSMQADVKGEFKALQVIVGPEKTSKEIEQGKDTWELQSRINELERHLEAAHSKLRVAGLLEEVEHFPEGRLPEHKEEDEEDHSDRRY